MVFFIGVREFAMLSCTKWHIIAQKLHKNCTKVAQIWHIVAQFRHTVFGANN